MTGFQLRSVFLKSMVWSLAVTAVLGVAAIVFPHFAAEWRVLLTTLTFGLSSMVAMGCAMVLERRRLVGLMWAGLACTVLALVTWLTAIWSPNAWYHVSEELVQLGGTFTVASVAIVHVGGLSIRRFDRPAMESVRIGTLAMAAAMGVFVVALIWFFDPIENVIDDDILLRGMAVMGILIACGTVATPVLWKIQGIDRRESGAAVPSRVSIELVCPRCSMRQTMRAGPGRCAACHLGITIDVEEPRCTCGYLLYKLGSDRCPECGRGVRAEAA